MAYRILVVDAERKICEILRVFLSKKGFEVKTVLKAEKVIALLEADENPDLVVLDEKTSAAAGADILKELKDRIPGIPCIVMTGSYRMNLYENRPEKTGYAELLYKPVDLNMLVERIYSILKAGKDQDTN